LERFFFDSFHNYWYNAFLKKCFKGNAKIIQKERYIETGMLIRSKDPYLKVYFNKNMALLSGMGTKLVSVYSVLNILLNTPEHSKF